MYCIDRVQRTCLRTKGCMRWDDENQKEILPNASNFVLHTEKCPSHPECHNFFPEWTVENTLKLTIPQLQAQEQNDSTKHIRRSASQNSRTIMASFLKQGLEKPAKEFSMKFFRELLIKAICEDDHPFTFAEGSRVKNLLLYMIPTHARLPCHQTVCLDIEKLFQGISASVTASIQDSGSRFSIATDIWTAKSFVYSFSGIIAFWIDRDWRLPETVLKLIPLYGRHGGSECGRLLFKALVKHGLLKKILASAADHATSNAVMNRSLCRRFHKVHPQEHPLLAEDTQLGCGAHGINLVVQWAAIFRRLDLLDDQ